MKNCNFKKNALIAYCYGELNPDKMKQIEEHLNTCRSCSSEVDALNKTITLVKQQKLKDIPEEMLDNYTSEIRERLAKEVRPGFVAVFRERLDEIMESIRFVFSPRLIPVAVAVCIVVVIFSVMHRSGTGSLNLINQDIALLDELGEYADEAFIESDVQGLANGLQSLDEIVFAQAVEDAELEDILYELQELEELGEEIPEDDVSEDLQDIDELEMELAVG